MLLGNTSHYTCPANFPEDVVKSLPSELESGVYFGWASVNQGPVYKMVMSIGWNPQFQNEKRSMVSAGFTCQHSFYVVSIIGDSLAT